MKRVFSALGWAILFTLGYLLIQLLVSIGFGIVIGLIAALDGPVGGEAYIAAVASKAAAATAYISLVSNILAGLAVWGVCALRRQRLKEALCLRPLPLSQAGISGGFGLICGIALLLLLNLLPASMLESYAAQSSALTTGPFLPRLIAYALAAPLLEEMLFRGLIYNALRKGMGRAWAIGICSVIFGLMHGHPVWMVYAAVLGVLLCLLRDACSSLWAPIIFHICINLMGTFILPYCPWAYNWAVLLLSLAACVLLWRKLGLGREMAPPEGNV